MIASKRIVWQSKKIILLFLLAFVVIVSVLTVQHYNLASITTDDKDIIPNPVNEEDEEPINEKPDNKTYYVYWLENEKTIPIDDTLYTSKNKPFIQTIKIPQNNLKSISFKLTWKDDLTTPLFHFGKDTLTLSIKAPNDTELFEEKSIGEGTINFNVVDINAKPSITSIDAENISAAKRNLKNHYNVNWKNEPIQLKVNVQIGEISILRRQRDKGNDFKLQVFYEYYESDVSEIKDNPPNTYILSGSIGVTNHGTVTFSWAGDDDITQVEQIEYSYKLTDYDNDWSPWITSTSKTYCNLAEREYTFFVKAKDHMGNIDPIPAKQSFTVKLDEDVTPPETTITNGPSGTIDHNDVTFTWMGSDDITSAGYLQYSYKLLGKDSDWSTWTTSTSKTYIDLPDVAYTFKVKAMDGAGNTDLIPAQRSFVIEIKSGNDDTEPPITMILTGPSGTINDNTATFAWTGSDDFTSTGNLRYSYKLVGRDSSWSSWTTSTSKTYDDLSNREYTFKVKAKDQAGNIDSTPATMSFTVDVEEKPDRFATSVVELNFGEDHHLSYTDPSKALGGPHGLGDTMGSLDVLSLGKNGDITFGFDVTITNGPGKDFIVFENPFFINSQPGKIFAELMYVEVSTDGINFARFPSISNTLGPGSICPNNVTNLAGVWPVYANVGEDGNDMEPDPFNSNEAGGDAFDLDDLVNHPLVQSGDIDLQNINYIKLIDILGDGSNLDSQGSPIYDPTDMDNGADVDAISVINYI